MEYSKGSCSLLPETAQALIKINAQNRLSAARKRLVSKHTEATREVVDPSTGKPPPLNGRERAKYPKLTATENILTAKVPSPDPTSLQQHLLRINHVSIEAFYAQLEEIRLIHVQFNLLARSTHAQVHPQARR